ncbi:MAG TPA: hypothetical protein VES38_06590 [Methylotenera sp.]|nr:hypothetical protein [Methylotenera sp.]
MINTDEVIKEKMNACGLLDAVKQIGVNMVTEKQIIETMVSKFLGWKLPDDFSPDAGISFEPEFNKEYMASIGEPPMKHNPVGTNLFNAVQAKEMITAIAGEVIAELLTASNNKKDALNRIAEQLKATGASVPAPEAKGTLESSIITGLSIALSLVNSEIEQLSNQSLSADAETFKKQRDDLGAHVVPVYAALDTLLEHAEEVEMDDLLGRFAPNEFWHELEDALNEPPALSTDKVDAERLNWLEKDMQKEGESVAIEYRDGKFRLPYLVSNAGGFGGGVGEYFADNLREAIDQAIALSKVEASPIESVNTTEG